MKSFKELTHGNIYKKNILKNFFKETKNFYWLPWYFFIIAFIGGAIFGYITVDGHTGQISSGLGETNTDGEVFLSSIELFIHNFSSDLTTIAFGLLLSIMSLVITAINRVNRTYIWNRHSTLDIWNFTTWNLWIYCINLL